MAGYWQHINRVLESAEIILSVLDARMPEETRYFGLEKRAKQKGKKILYVLNKCDLIGKEKADKIKKKYSPCVFVSSTQRLGTTLLLKKILELSQGKAVIVGVVGYPNVGKSTLINAIAGRAKARTSSESGYTKGIQKIKVNNKIMLLDTPGVFPPQKEQQNYGLTGAVSAEKLRDPEAVALYLLEEHGPLLCAYYEVSDADAETILEEIAKKLHYLRKEGQPDIERAARRIVGDWQKGKIEVK